METGHKQANTTQPTPFQPFTQFDNIVGQFDKTVENGIFTTQPY
jgi:hypothetical protein